MEKWLVRGITKRYNFSHKIDDDIYVIICCIIRQRLRCDKGLEAYVRREICNWLRAWEIKAACLSMIAAHIEKHQGEQLWGDAERDLVFYRTKVTKKT